MSDYRAESITQQKGGYTGASVSPAEMASAAGQFADSDKMKDKWKGRGGKLEALKSDPSIVNTMNQAKANLANWNATKGKELGYPAGMNTIAGVKPLTNLMLDRNLNVGAGVNPTTGMGFMDSIKSNAYVDRPLPSAGKGILGLLSGVTGVPGMALGMLPNLFKNLSTDIGNTYNAFGNMVRAPSITSGLTGLYDDFTQGLKAESVPLMQGVDNPFDNLFNTAPAEGMNRWGMPSEFDTDQGLWTGAYKSGAVAPEEVTQSLFTGTPMKKPDVYQYTGGTPPVTIQDQYKIDPSIYNPNLNFGLEPDQVGRDIMVNPGNDIIGYGAGQVDPQLAAGVGLNEMKPFNSIAAQQITNPNSTMNQMYNEMGVNQNNQQMGQAITDTFPSYGYIPDMFPDKQCQKIKKKKRLKK